MSLIGIAGVVVACAVGLILYALTDQIVFFQSPTDIAEHPVPPQQRIRLGGLVKEGTVVRGQGTTVTFTVTDTANDVPVTFTGILPDLFREGQGVVVEGMLAAGGTFAADTVLAKHDENYMPKEVADSLKKQGVWRDTETN
ncbi:cytochrome c-type biogenesis protein CcmE [Rhodobium orientis]|nr:cytochrome c-type biogenesis protein CcmE [Rhodobium orientis]